MKKLLSVFFALALVLTCVFVLSPKADAAIAGVYTYTVTDGEVTITGCDTDVSGKITVPSTLGGYPVTVIGDNAFQRCYNMTSVVIPDSVKAINSYAFSYCTSLTSVTIGNGPAEIGYCAFAYCENLTSFSVGNNVAAINPWAFSSSTNIRYNIYDNGKYLGNSGNPYVALVDVTDPNLTSCKIHPNTRLIAAHAFSSCSKLTSISIPNNVAAISESAFSYCSSLSSLTIGNKVKTIGNDAFQSCTSLASVTIPNSVTVIGDSAFHSCNRLSSVTIGKSVTTIGNYAFAHCARLGSINIPSSVKFVGESAFLGCSRLSSAILGNGITALYMNAFCSCSNLTDIFLPASVTQISMGAFNGCDSLTEVYYAGNQTQLSEISVGWLNEPLYNATFYYNQFPDVKLNAWYYGAVQFAVQKGYFSGNGDGTFGPGNNITRQDFVVVLSRIAGANLSQYSGKTSFTDVPSNAYYAKAIHWATANGVISGYNATKFGVGDALTREQLVTILSRYAAKKGVNVKATDAAKAKLNTYSDANKVNPAMRDAVAWALQNKVISGMTSTTVGPQGKATRAQVAAILFNISSYKIIPGI